MGQLAFNIKGVSRKKLRKVTRRAQPDIASSPIALLAGASIFSLFILGLTLPGFVSLMSGAKVVNLCGVSILGSEIALIVDNSGSMKTTARQNILKTQREAMLKKEMSITPYLTWMTLLGGSDFIGRLLAISGVGDIGSGPATSTQPIEITGKLTLENSDHKNAKDQ